MHHDRAQSAIVNRILLGQESQFIPQGRVLSGLNQALNDFRGAEILDTGDQILVAGKWFQIENNTEANASSESTTDNILPREP
jgi:hypothetical protein